MSSLVSYIDRKSAIDSLLLIQPQARYNPAF